MLVRYSKPDFWKGRTMYAYCLFGIIPIYIKWEY